MEFYNELSDNKKALIKDAIKMANEFQLTHLDQHIFVEMSSNRYGLTISFCKPCEDSRHGCAHKYFEFSSLRPAIFEDTLKEFENFLNSDEVKEYNF